MAKFHDDSSKIVNFLLVLVVNFLSCLVFLTASTGRGPKNHFFFIQKPFLNSQCYTGKLLFPVPHWEIPVTFPFNYYFPVSIPFQLLFNTSYYPFPVTIPFQVLSHSSYYSIPATIQSQLVFHYRYYSIPVTIQS